VQRLPSGLAEECRTRFGRADVLVNNASIYADLGGKRPFTEIPADEWERVLRVNVTGTWLATRALHPLLTSAPAGRVINIASATALMGTPHFLHYVASKGAVIAMTRSLAKEMGPAGVTVNAIAPGLVQNESSARLNDDSDAYFSAVARQRAIARGMDPGDLVGAVGFLASPEAGFITGQTLIVDGGVTFS
jgi:NAD(P)-dependent dehydrogenase (short-subunit alcohol dehydrogenase family)